MLNRLKPKSEFTRNVVTLMTGTTIAQAIPIAISPILTRLYTPEDFGVFALFIAITGVISVIASGRYELALMLPKKEEDAINIFVLGIIIIILLTLLLLIIMFFVYLFMGNLVINSKIGYWFYFIPVAFFFVGFFNLLSYYNNRIKRYKDIAHATVLKSVILATIQLLMGFLKMGASGLISGQIISSLFANIRLLKNIIKNKNFLTKIKKIKIIALARYYKNFPKYQAPLAILNTFSSQIPIYIFTPFFGLTIVGFYSLSTRIVFSPLMILAGSTAKVYNQKLTQLHNKNGNTYKFTINLLKSIAKKIIIPFLIIVIFSPEIFAFIFGEKWKEAGVYTQVLSPWIFMVFLVSTISFIPNLLNMQKKALWLEFVYTILRIVAIGIGVLEKSVIIALIGYSVVGFVMLSYNMLWMLSLLKKEN